MLSKLLRILLSLLPAALFCSYYPIISLGATSSMNLELSLPLLWLIIFDSIGVVGVIVRRITLLRSIKKSQSLAFQSETPVKTGRRAGSEIKLFWLTTLFPLYSTLSILWSPNPPRALLTAGIIWALFLAIFIIIFLLPTLNFPKAFAKNMLIAFFVASIFACLICWAQCFLDIAGFAREQTLLCAGCTYLSFGFPHPSGLAIEPQFMGNLLLAPTLTALYLLIFPKTDPKTDKNSPKLLQKPALIALASFFSATLFLTFSRGAIYAYAIALAVLLIFALKSRQKLPQTPKPAPKPFLLALISIPVATFLATLAIQGLFAQISPTSETFISGIDKAIDQLSLGIVDLIPSKTSQTSSDPQTPIENQSTEDQSSGQSATETSSDVYFDGYVSESTNIRLSLSETALRTWAQNPQTILFGVGLGGAGTAMHAFNPGAVATPKEIVQNQPISILLELGLVGSILILLALTIAFFAPWLYSAKISKHLNFSLARHPALPLLLALIVAYLITLQFFAGLPNAIHIYLLPPLLYLILAPQPSPKHLTNKKYPQAPRSGVN